MGFLFAVKGKYQITAGGMPREDYPPLNIAEYIKTCEHIGRHDLAQAIREQWVKVLNKYPKTRINWPTANVIGTRSIKKNVFGGMEFVLWLQQKASISTEQAMEAKAIPAEPPMPKDVPAIAIPKKDETPESWRMEAEKTKQSLVDARKGFTDARSFVGFLEREVQNLTQNIFTYGEGGPKHRNKDGKPSKDSTKVLSWKAALETTAEILDETKRQITNAESAFKKAADNYHNTPITTEAYERKAQKSLDSIRDYVEKMEDLDKQRDLLAKLAQVLKDAEEVNSSVITAGAGDKISALIGKIKDSMKEVRGWLKGFKGAIDSFSELASLRY